MFKYLLDQLSSGLTVVRVPMSSAESITVLAFANTGSRYETKTEEGIAHFFEHIVFKGTTNYPNAQSLATAIDEIGADFNAFTSKEYTGYFVKSATQHLERSLDVVSDMLLRPLIKEVDINRERSVIIEEINMYQDTPMRQVGSNFEKMMFKGSGLSHEILGSKANVNRIKRKDFLQFLKKWYCPANLVLVVTGDERKVASASILGLIEKYFGKEHQQRCSERVDTVKLAQQEQAVSSQKLSLEYKQTEQAHLVMGWQGLPHHDERRYALSLLSIIIGGNMSSRLFTEVREKRGLCYYIRTDVDNYHNTGVFGVSAGVDPTRIEEALKVITTEFYQVADGTKPITQQELQRAKDYLNGITVLGLEDSRAVAQFFGLRKVLTGQILTPDEVLVKLNQVSLTEVRQVAQELIIPHELKLAVIGPYKDEQVFKELIK